MSTFGTMQTRILRETQRADITADVAAAIETAIDTYRRQRFAFNVATASAALSASVAVLALPAGYIDLDRLELSASASGVTTYQVKQDRTFDQIRDERNAQAVTTVAQPAHMAIFAQQFHFDTPADDNYNSTIWYLRDLPEVSAEASSAATNAWVDTAERLIRAKAKQLLYEDRLYNFRRALVYERQAEEARRALIGEVPTRDRIQPTEF